MLTLATLLALSALVYAASASPRASTASTPNGTAATTVTVVMREFRFLLSRRSVPAGTVTFRLINKGRVAHNFKIAGKKSALIKPGKSGLLKVTFSKAGSFAYTCTVPGHAKAGMKGVLRIVAAGATSNVAVDMVDFAFQLSTSTVPHGTIVFSLTNRGSVGHNMRIAGNTSVILGTGETGTFTVTIVAPGSYPYICTIPGHAEAGMKGVLRAM